MIDHSVVTLKDYGKIVFHVKTIMDKQGMTRGRLAKLANIRFEVADKRLPINGITARLNALTQMYWPEFASRSIAGCKIS